MEKPPLLLVALIAFLSAGFGAVVWKKSREQSALEKTVVSLQASLADREAQAEKDRAEIAALKAKSEAFRSESAELRTKLATGGGAPQTDPSAAATGAGSAPGDAPKAEEKGGGFMKGIAKMFTDPEMKKAMRGQQAMMVRMMYGDLAKELGLSPNEAGPILEVLTERQMSMAAKSMEAMSGDMNDPAKLEESGKAVEATKKGHDEQLKALLGDERMKKLEAYERTLGDRMQMQQIQQSFAATGIPLQDAERDGLLSIMKEERLKTPPSPFEPGSKDVGKQVRAMRTGEGVEQAATDAKAFNARVLDRARTVLRPEQVNALEAAQKQQLEMMEMGIKMSREMFKGSAPAEPAKSAP